MKKFEYYKADSESAIFAAKRLLIDSIWKQANIELPGAITFPETLEIFEGRIPENSDVNKVLVVNNIKHAWQFLLENRDYPIDHQLISEYNKLLGSGGLVQNPGQFRRHNVAISATKYVPVIPTLDLIQDKLKAIEAIENPIEKSLSYFAEIARGQWFSDGNKRTAQMVANHSLLQMSCGLFAVPVEENTHFVTHLLNFYESNDSEQLFDYLYDTSIRILPGGFTPKMIREELNLTVPEFIQQEGKIAKEDNFSKSNQKENNAFYQRMRESDEAYFRQSQAAHSLDKEEHKRKSR